MCFAVYIACSTEIEECAWNKSAPAFYVESVSDGEKVRAQFSLPFVYYAGSQKGCGCGFLKDGEIGEDLIACQLNYRRLAECASEALSNGAKIEIFSCWEGDQVEPVELAQTLSAHQLDRPEFEFQEKHFMKVTS